MGRHNCGGPFSFYGAIDEAIFDAIMIAMSTPFSKSTQILDRSFFQAILLGIGLLAIGFLWAYIEIDVDGLIYSVALVVVWFVGFTFGFDRGCEYREAFHEHLDEIRAESGDDDDDDDEDDNKI